MQETGNQKSESEEWIDAAPLSAPEEGGKGLIEIEALFKHTMMKVTQYINTSMMYILSWRKTEIW